MNRKQDTYYYQNINNYTIGNSLIERTWVLKRNGLFSVKLLNKITNHEYATDCNIPCFSYEGLTFNKHIENSFYDFSLVNVEQNFVIDSIYSKSYCHIIFEFKDSLHGVDFKYNVMVYDYCAAIKTYIEIKSVNSPMGEFYKERRFNTIDVLPFSMSESVTSFEFFTRTDFTNELLAENEFLTGFDSGNILLSNGDQNGFFVIKESPCFSDQRYECDGNFLRRDGFTQILGTGIRPEEICSKEFTRTYATIVGVFEGTEDDGIRSIKQFQKTAYIVNSDRETILMANPWGDRKCLEHMSEEFVMKEIDACSEIGIDCYQVDDGWQKGGSFKRMNKLEKIEDNYWDIDNKKFPHGFDKIVEYAKQKKVELTLWFAPNFNNLYADFNREIDLLRMMYQKYGISMFKIDGVKLRTKLAEDRVETIFRTLRDETKGEIYFNLDITADPRSGYFMFLQYGNIFLENRYTDWGNYFPYLTLKNMWDISRFIPVQRLQIEVLNKSRNKDKYTDNILAPINYSYSYIFAIAMFSNPLIWCEVSQLDSQAKCELSKMIEIYKKYCKEIAQGDIFPIGNRPNGYSFTGFQSISEDYGFIIVFREYTETKYFDFKLKCLDNANIELINLVDDSKNEESSYTFKAGCLRVEMQLQNSFKLYKYKIVRPDNGEV